MPEMSILIVALLGFAGGFLLRARTKSVPAVRAEAEAERDRAAAAAGAAHAATKDAIEADRRADDTGDVADRLNNLAKRKEIRK